MNRVSVVLAVLVVNSASALSLSRRGVAKVVAGASAGALANAANAAVAPCPSGSNNCFSTASTDKSAVKPWTWPAGTSAADARKELKAVVDAYPLEGQDKVDLGGWSYVEDKLVSDGSAKLEYRSGLGNMAKFFNGGKPFVDDVEIVVADSVAVRSSSRVGDSDLGVNAKRLNYLAAKLREKGWSAPAI